MVSLGVQNPYHDKWLSYGKRNAPPYSMLARSLHANNAGNLTLNYSIAGTAVLDSCIHCVVGGVDPPLTKHQVLL
jgi:hypothetical protein